MNSLHPFLDKVTQGDCIHVLRRLPDACIDFVLTDPPYLVRYQDESGRTIANDDNPRWLYPAFAEVYRVLKPDRYCVSFYGWGKVEKFLAVWKELGLFPVGHFVFVKRYPSARRHTEMRHEQAYLLAKGRPTPPKVPSPDLIEFRYSGNTLHPTQKPEGPLVPLIEAFTKPGEVILDLFTGSGSTGAAARPLDRHFVLVDKDTRWVQAAQRRLVPAPRPGRKA